MNVKEEITCTEHCHCEDNHNHNHKSDEKSCGCGLCGLENLSASSEAEAEINSTSRDNKRIFIIKAMLTIIFMAVNFLYILPQWAEMILTGAVIFIWGWELFLNGIKGILKLSLDENSLMSIAVVAAFILGEYTEAVLVVVLFSVGEMLEEMAVSKSRKDISAVVNIRPQTANIIKESGEISLINSAKIKLGDLLLIKAGEKVPVDCEIIDGETSLDQSALTGEAVAVGAQKGDTVLAGAVNLSGAIRCRATTTFEDSTASRIIKLVEESAIQKGQTEKLITRFAKIYTPIVVLCAVLVAALPPILGLGSFSMWVMRALVFLVASCPCALVISVPLGFYSGVGAISRHGMLVKGTKFIEPLAKMQAAVFDKTGTITTGELTLSEVKTISSDSTKANNSSLLYLSAIAESYSNHPMAKAIVAAYEKDFGKADLSGVASAKEIAGKGVKLIYNGETLLCGSVRLLRENGIPDTDTLPKANVYTALAGKVIGYLILSDLPRNEAKEAIASLKKLGVSKAIMLTGDSNMSALIVKEKVGLDETISELLPQDKANILAEIKSKIGVTAFVGDGINDAPVIAAADVGIAMGLGSDAAIESADAVLMSQNLNSLVSAIKISRRTLSIVHFNIWFIMLVKGLVLVLGIFGITNMWMAVFADVGLSILTVLNSVRILRS